MVPQATETALEVLTGVLEVKGARRGTAVGGPDGPVEGTGADCGVVPGAVVA